MTLYLIYFRPKLASIMLTAYYMPLLHFLLVLLLLCITTCSCLTCICTADQSNCNKTTLKCDIDNGYCRTSTYTHSPGSSSVAQSCDNSICQSIFPIPANTNCCPTDLCNIYTTTIAETTPVTTTTTAAGTIPVRTTTKTTTATSSLSPSNSTSMNINNINTSKSVITPPNSNGFPLTNFLQPKIIIPLIGSVIFLLILLVVIILIIVCCVYYKMSLVENRTYNPQKDAFSNSPREECESLSFLSSGRMTDSGSGSSTGAIPLTNTTIANQVILEKTIGYGRYGEVWKGTWKGQNVAIKKFYSPEVESWKTEVEIYHTSMIRHEYILGFIASDKFSDLTIEYWIITDYMENGSLHEYLTENELNVSDVIRLSKSAVSGVTHLHTEITGRRDYVSKNCNEASKPAIAHRDIKSRNILINRHFECVLADFGLAVRHNSEEEKLIMRSNDRTGTSRYMAPEILDDTMDKSKFESYRRADMYALGLVLWEICCRCKVGDKIEPCEYPYYEHVDRDPSLEKMREIVVVNKARPQIPEYWLDVRELRTLAQVMTECWCTDASSRLPALRVRKNITALLMSSN